MTMNNDGSVNVYRWQDWVDINGDVIGILVDKVDRGFKIRKPDGTFTYVRSDSFSYSNGPDEEPLKIKEKEMSSTSILNDMQSNTERNTIISNLKKNLATFGNHPEKIQQIHREIDIDNFLFLTVLGHWEMTRAQEFWDDGRYKLKDAYYYKAPEPEPKKFESLKIVYPDDNDTFYPYAVFDGGRLFITSAFRRFDVIGFLYKGCKTIRPNFRMYRDVRPNTSNQLYVSANCDELFAGRYEVVYPEFVVRSL